jgi:hypothetical protein
MADRPAAGEWPPPDAGGWPHQPGGNCPHCQILGIDFGEDDPDSDPGATYPPPATGTITPGTRSDFDPWATRVRPRSNSQL